MAASTSTKGKMASCPFCYVSYKGLGFHLRHCEQRNGRDYSQYLAPKTLMKSQPRKIQCPKCAKLFARLDTHLRRSAVCRSIPPSPSPPVDQQVHDPVDTQVPAGEAAIFLTPQNSNSAAVATPASCETTNNIPSHLALPVVKSPLTTLRVGRLLMTTSKTSWCLQF